jgi:hypothetical protein
VYRFPFETAFMVWSGVLTVEWHAEDGQSGSAVNLGTRDLVQIPAAQAYRLANAGTDVTRAAVMIGTPAPPEQMWRADTAGA